MEADWKVLNNHLQAKLDGRTVADVKKQLGDAHLGGDDQPFTKKRRSQLQKLLIISDGWEAAKNHGTGVLKGGALSAAQAVLGKLRQIGVHIVPSGETESLVPETPTRYHGPGWASKVIDDDSYKELSADSQKFVLDIVDACILPEPPDSKTATDGS